MPRTLALAGALVLIAGVPLYADDAPALQYPKAKTVDQVDDYHGTKVADPYRWMEDLDSPDVAAWVAEENAVSGAYLEKIPERETIRQRLTELWNYEKFEVPFREGGRTFLTKNDGLQNQGVLYWLDGLEGEPHVLLDPNTLSADGTVALSETAVSRDGKKLAYALAAAGSDWQEWRGGGGGSGKELAGKVEWTKCSDAAWTTDGAGFFYSRYDKPAAGQEREEQNYFHKLYFHRLGDPQEKDALIYERKDHKEWGFDGKVSDDGRYLVVTV